MLPRCTNPLCVFSQADYGIHAFIPQSKGRIDFFPERCGSLCSRPLSIRSEMHTYRSTLVCQRWRLRTKLLDKSSADGRRCCDAGWLEAFISVLQVCVGASCSWRGSLLLTGKGCTPLRSRPECSSRRVFTMMAQEGSTWPDKGM